MFKLLISLLVFCFGSILQLQAQNYQFQETINIPQFTGESSSPARGICLKNNILYVALNGSNAIWVKNLSSGIESRLSVEGNPYDVDVDEFGNLYVACRSAKKVVKLNSSGQLLYELPQSESVNGVTIGPDGKLYVASLLRITIYKGQQKVDEIATLSIDKFREVRKVFFDSEGTLYIADKNTGILKLNGYKNGNGEVTWRLKNSEDGKYNNLAYLTVSPTGDILVSSEQTKSPGKLGIYCITNQGLPDGTIGIPGEGGSFSQPYGIACDRKNNLYVVDNDNIQVWAYQDNEAPIISAVGVSDITRSTLSFTLISNEQATVYYSIQADEPTESQLLKGLSFTLEAASLIKKQLSFTTSNQILKVYYLVEDTYGNRTPVYSTEAFSIPDTLALSYLITLQKQINQAKLELSANDSGSLYWAVGANEFTEEVLLNQGKIIPYECPGLPMTFLVPLQGEQTQKVSILLKTAQGERSKVYTQIVKPYSDVDCIREKLQTLLLGDSQIYQGELLDRYNALLSQGRTALQKATAYNPDQEGLIDFDLSGSKQSDDIYLLRSLLNDCLFPLSLVYQIKGLPQQPNEFYHNPAVLEQIFRLYDYMARRNLKTGCDLPFAGGGMYLRFTGYTYASFLMRHELERTGRFEDVIQMMEWATRWVVPNPTSELLQTGGGDWSAEGLGNTSRSDGVRTIYNNRLLFLLTQNDCDKTREEKLHYLVHALDAALQPHDAWDGFLKPDYSTYHHLGMWGNAYGVDALHASAQMAWLLHNTEYALSPSVVEHLALGLEAFSQYSAKYHTSRGLCGRFPNSLTTIVAHIPAYAYLYDILPQGDLKQRMGGIFANLYHPDYSLVYYKCVRDVASGITFAGGIGTLQQCKRLKEQNLKPLSEVTLNRTFPFGAMQIHRRNDWLVTLKGVSKYAWDYEINGSENWYGRNQGNGSLLIYNGHDNDGVVTAEASGLGYDGYDWCHVPGTTVPALTISEVLNDGKKFAWPRFSNEAFVGGVTDGINGAYGYKYSDVRSTGWNKDSFNPVLTARKSYFFYNNLIIALGSDINNTLSGKEAHTTIFQDFLTDPNQATSVDGNMQTGVDYQLDIVEDRPITLVDHIGNAYYLPNAKGLHIQRSLQFSRNDRNITDTQGNYATAWINHGRKQTNAHYEYAILVNGNKEVGQLQENPTNFYKVEQQDHVAHIVSFGEDVRGISLFEGNQPLKDALVVEADEPCVIWINQFSKGSLALSVANPDLGYFPKGNEWGKFSHQAWSINASMQFKKSEIQPVEILLNGVYALAEPSDKVTLEVQADNKHTLITFKGINAESVKVNLKDLSVGVTDIQTGDSSLQLYRSLVSEMLSFSYVDKQTQQARIIDPTGRVCIQSTLSLENTHHLDVSTLTPGLYLLQVGTEVVRFFKN